MVRSARPRRCSPRTRRTLASSRRALWSLRFQHPPVELELPLAGARRLGGAAALALQVRPRAHEARALPGQLGEGDLEASFAALRPEGEDLEDEPGAIQDLDPEAVFQIALLAGREGGIDEEQLGRLGAEPGGGGGALARGQESRRRGAGLGAGGGRRSLGARGRARGAGPQ